ncbi:MAG: 30S ribosomal protein S21 [Campylobacterales bacterium]|jgi:small subunit ribosomal protein S21|nr:30S ribosomal protein S21 [Campylobacterales bacterium]
MPGVILKSDDNFEAAYRRFKKQTDRNLIVTEARARRFHETETDKRKKEKITTRKKILKRLFMMRRYESRL